MDAPPVQYVTTSDGLSIAYTVCGEGRPLVQLPSAFNDIQGTVDGHMGLTSWLDGLASRFRFVRYDGRGQGLSSRGLRQETSVVDLVRDLEELVDHVRLEQVTLFAEGWNGHVAVRYAVRHPDRVGALVLMSPSAVKSAWASGVWEVLPRENWDLFLRTLVALNPSPEEPEVTIRNLRQTISQQDWEIRGRALMLSDLSDILRSLRAPTLVLHPRNRLQLPAEEPAKLAARIENARLVLIDGQRAFGDAEQGIRAIESFLADLPPGQSSSRSTPLAGLSAREIEVLRLLAMGKSNPQIADELVISLNTVQHHVSNILSKTGLANRTEAAAYAHRLDLT